MCAVLFRAVDFAPEQFVLVVAAHFEGNRLRRGPLLSHELEHVQRELLGLISVQGGPSSRSRPLAALAFRQCSKLLSRSGHFLRGEPCPAGLG